MMIQLGLGLVGCHAFIGGDAPDIPQGTPSITALPFDGYVFDAAGSNTAEVTLGGTAVPDAPIQVRGASGGGQHLVGWHSGRWHGGMVCDV